MAGGVIPLCLNSSYQKPGIRRGHMYLDDPTFFNQDGDGTRQRNLCLTTNTVGKVVKES